ncbi:MAG: excinuclease ABC subunit UvrC [Candidatus Omnitrophica bacterium]|nr:excinuclease ABC subunit UvrC [Candidatus Omnitrophota bacterium]
MDIKEKIKSIPDTFGVYIMKDKNGEVIYVGKATSLRKRVNSYFSKPISLKVTSMIKNVADIEYIVCNSEEQALILEAALIKERKPRYNIALRDDKSYPYVEITNEEFPRIFISRPKRQTNNLLFGPYPKAKLLKAALRLIRGIFGYRSCKNLPKNACLFYHINLCPAPCIKKISATDYKDIVENIIKILKGERKELLEKLEEKMKILAERKEFEEAQRLRDKIFALHNLYQGLNFKHQLLALKELLSLERIPLTIEAIDISSLMGNYMAGSVVTFKDGMPDKSNYRRFRIKGVTKIDDYAAIAEVVRRRYTRLLRENKKLPDLVIIDGGKGHLETAKKELNNLALSIPIIAISKNEEKIWLLNKEEPLTIVKSHPGLQLIQRLRDEAHRFAHKYHLVMRKNILKK